MSPQRVDFDQDSVDRTTLDIVEKETCGTITATSVLRSRTVAGSRTTVNMTRGSTLFIDSLKVGGTLALEAPPVL